MMAQPGVDGRGKRCHVFARMAIYRVDFHNHCKGDPVDILGYTARQLVDRAAECGLHAVAITPHGRVFDDPDAVAYAAGRGILLIPGIEKMIDGREVVLLNVAPDEVPTHFTWDDMQALRARRGAGLLVMAPHPFYPMGGCLREKLVEHETLFDAVEHAHFHGLGWNPNGEAVRFARERGKALLANTDCHVLWMMGRSWTEVEAGELTAESVFAAIRAGRCREHASAPGLLALAGFLVQVTGWQLLLRLAALVFKGDRRLFGKIPAGKG
jgi:predicted metal-dependent phosphoesterase TrpH